MRRLVISGRDGITRPGTLLGVLLLLFLVTVGLQWHNGAYWSDLGAQPDEAAHYVTGLMVRDYVMALAPAPPMRYAEQYYLHYPKVAMGHWPPVFYVVEAAWTMVFSESESSVMVLMALCGALLAMLAASVAAREYGWGAGIGVGVAVAAAFWVQSLTRRVTPDVLTAALIVAAALLYARYMEDPKWPVSVAFGLAASMACLTKGSGFVLAFVPGFSVVLTRRWSLLRSFSFWLPAGIVTMLCAPWYLLAPSGLHTAAIAEHSVFLVKPASTATWVVPRLASSLNVALVVLAALGVLIVVVRLIRRRDRVRPEWVVMVALLLGYWALCIVVSPARDAKNMIVCVVPMVLLAALALAWLPSTAPARTLPRKARMATLALAVAAFGMSESSRMTGLEYRGYRELVRDLTSLREGRNSATLISSDSAGEGALVAQVAMTDNRPGSYVLRGSKVLAHSGWFGEHFQLRYQSGDEVMAFLESVPVTWLVLDSAPREPPGYYVQLREAVRTHPGRWQLVGRYPGGTGDGPGKGALELYKLAGPPPKITGSFEVNLESSLGRVLRFEPR